MPKAKKTGGQDFGPRPIPDAGMHNARCISVIDYGTQVEEWKGEKKMMHKIALTFELVDTRHVFTEEKGEQPFVLNMKFTNSLGEKATLRKVLLSWRGKPFTAKEEEEFDVNIVCGKPALLNVTHTKSKDGTKDYANISTINPPMKGVKIAPAVNPVFTFDIGEKDQFEKFEKLYKWQQEIIKLSPEWQSELAKKPKGSTAAKALPGGDRGEDDEF